MQQRATDWITKAPAWIRSTVPARVRSLIGTVRDKDLVGTVRDMERINLNGRGRTALIASVALVGTGLAGAVTTSVYTASHHSDPKTSQVVAVDADRATADRANRATRPEAAASPTDAASVPAPAAAQTSAAPTEAAPAPVVAAPAPPAPKPAWVAPMGQYSLTSCYGPRWGTEHQGIDFANVAGTPELAAAAGTVLWAGWNAGGYGNFVVIDHGNSTWTLYGHAEQVLVSPGQHVEPGQEIALEGTTGDSTGPHLHFEVWNGLWSRIEPAQFLRDHGVSLPGC